MGKRIQYTGTTEEKQSSCAFHTSFETKRQKQDEKGRNTSSSAAVSLYDPSREKGIAERPQAFRYPENKNNSSAIYAQSERGAHFKSSVPPLPQALRLTTQSPTWKNSAAGCAAATKKASGCGARRGAMHGWRCTGAPDTPCPGCASSGSGRRPPHT